MATDVLDAAPQPYITSRRSRERRVGILVTVVAALLFVVFLVSTFVLLLMAATMVPGRLVPVGLKILALGFLLASLSVLMAHWGVGLIEGRQLCCVYLRRFRLNVNVIDPAHKQGLGRRVRLFTLDDQHFVPTEVPPLDRWLTRFGPAIGLVGVVFLLNAVTHGLMPVHSDDNDYAWMLALFFLGCSTWLAAFCLCLLLLYRWRLRRRDTLCVGSPDDLERAVAEVRLGSSWWTRPSMLYRQSTIVSVSDELWQQAVLTLAAQTNAVVIDISEPTANVAWEVQRLAESGIRFVLIAQDHRFRAFSTANGGDPVLEALLGSIGSHQVLTYELDDDEKLADFRARLRQRLFETARSPATMRGKANAVFSRLWNALWIAVVASAAAALVAYASIELYIPMIRAD